MPEPVRRLTAPEVASTEQTNGESDEYVTAPAEPPLAVACTVPAPYVAVAGAVSVNAA